MPCSLRVKSAQAIHPTGLSARSPAAQFDKLDYSTQAMQPKSKISSGYSTHKASPPGAQQLNLTSSTTLLRPCSLRVRSTQAIQPTGLSAQSLTAQFDELNYSTQAMQTKSQFSSGYSAHKASAPRAQQLSLTSLTTLLRPCSLRVRSAQAIQPTSLGAKGQQLSLSSSATILRPCSLRFRSAQAIQPTSLSAKSPAAQFDELDYFTQAMQPKSQISSGYSAHKASAPGAQ